MKNIVEKLKQEWERATLLAIALLVLLVLLVAAYHLLKDDGGSTEQSGSPPAPPEYFKTDTFAYVKSVKDLPPDVNPVVFRKQLPIPKAPEPPPKQGGKPQPPPKQGDPPKQGEKPQPPPKQGEKPQPPPKPGEKPQPPPKKEPPWVITVKYRGLYKGITGKEMAFIDAKNSRGNKQAQKVGRKFYLPANGRVYDAMTVRSFDAQQVVLSYGKGKEIALELGKEKKVTIDE
ncbi:MAG: hypothetical protein ACOX9E_08185 [Lentisphaeria bacterium]|jgi:outer membrane biosynthesis protein TonB